jgi:hypothetical protein
MAVEYSGRAPDWKYHKYFRLDLLCVGSDVFDLQVFMECDYSYRHRGRRMELSRRMQFKSLDALPNPIKREHHYYDTRVPSELSPGRVRIAIYHSGRRLLWARSSWRFRKLLREFCAEPPMRGGGEDLAGCGKSRLIVVSLPFIDWGASVTH